MNKMRKIGWVLFVVGTVVLFFNCAKTPSGAESQDNSAISAAVFRDSVTDFTVKVFYEPAATPYTGAIGLTGNDTWDIFQNSFQNLFLTHGSRTVRVPRTTADMTLIPAQGKSSWTQAELISLGNSLVPTYTSGTAVTIGLIFVKGNFNGNTQVLGVQFSGKPYAFIFKDIVTGTGGDAVTQRYVEQATVVHEAGHAVGLVNLGLPTVSNHEDLSRPHHTTNSSCVMHWQVESSSNILTSVTNFLTGNKLNLFGTQSLHDGQSYHP